MSIPLTKLMGLHKGKKVVAITLGYHESEYDTGNVK